MQKYQIIVKGIVKYLDNFLVVQRWYNDRVQDPFQWGFLDGEINFGEEPDKAVQRVVFENTGLQVQIDRILYTWSFMKGDVFTIGISYLLLANSQEVILSEELNSYEWTTRDNLPKYIENTSIIQDIDKAELN